VCCGLNPVSQWSTEAFVCAVTGSWVRIDRMRTRSRARLLWVGCGGLGCDGDPAVGLSAPNNNTTGKACISLLRFTCSYSQTSLYIVYWTFRLDFKIPFISGTTRRLIHQTQEVYRWNQGLFLCLYYQRTSEQTSWARRTIPVEFCVLCVGGGALHVTCDNIQAHEVTRSARSNQNNDKQESKH
jgi:hypothetical protein